MQHHITWIYTEPNIYTICVQSISVCNLRVHCRSAAEKLHKMLHTFLVEPLVTLKTKSVVFT